MDAYVYQAALLCEACAEHVKSEIDTSGTRGLPGWRNINDSDDYPQGPYPNGGGEADSPQHCDRCLLFLENPLTPDGYDYVESAIAEDLAHGRVSVAVTEWALFYGIPPRDAWTPNENDGC